MPNYTVSSQQADRQMTLPKTTLHQKRSEPKPKIPSRPGRPLNPSLTSPKNAATSAPANSKPRSKSTSTRALANSTAITSRTPHSSPKPPPNSPKPPPHNQTPPTPTPPNTATAPENAAAPSGPLRNPSLPRRPPKPTQLTPARKTTEKQKKKTSTHSPRRAPPSSAKWAGQPARVSAPRAREWSRPWRRICMSRASGWVRWAGKSATRWRRRGGIQRGIMRSLRSGRGIGRRKGLSDWVDIFGGLLSVAWGP